MAKVGHDAVEQPGQQWLASGRLAPDETTRLLHNLRELQSIYERHIAVEDNEIFPLAARVFDAGMLNEAAREMTKRRGQRFESPLSFQHR